MFDTIIGVIWKASFLSVAFLEYGLEQRTACELIDPWLKLNYGMLEV